MAGELDDLILQPWPKPPLDDVILQAPPKPPIDALVPERQVGGGIADAIGTPFTATDGKSKIRVRGPILAFYRLNGADGGVFGPPSGPEIEPAPGLTDNYEQFFRGGAIFWSEARGARGVTGAFFEHWLKVGSLHAPESDAVQIGSGVDRYVYQRFSGGYLYGFPGGEVVDTQDVEISFAGLICFAETPGLGSDEPYLIFEQFDEARVGRSGDLENAIRTQIFDDVDAGDSRKQELTIWSGQPRDVSIRITLWEHDNEDPDTVLKHVAALPHDAGAKLPEVDDAYLAGNRKYFDPLAMIKASRKPISRVKDIDHNYWFGPLKGMRADNPLHDEESFYEVYLRFRQVS